MTEPLGTADLNAQHRAMEKGGREEGKGGKDGTKDLLALLEFGLIMWTHCVRATSV